eukprot:augustus_masked-scaffold_7-processed-gene-8.1-mRNA-1 protein AED:0.44 eAED:0.44 QI:0/-1/0/1/-1/1/1/0/1128
MSQEQTAAEAVIDVQQYIIEKGEDYYEVVATNQGIKDGSIEDFCTKCLDLPVVSINLESNMITKNSVDFLSLLVLENQTLEELSLNKNYLATEGALIFIKSLLAGPHLKILHLEGNNIQSKVAVALHDVILNNDVLNELYLGENALDDSAVKIIVDAVRIKKVKMNNESGSLSGPGGSCIRVIDVTGNEVSQETLEELVNVLKQENFNIFRRRNKKLLWNLEAWDLAKSRFGTITIKEAIEELSEDDLKKLPAAGNWKNKKGQRIIEILLRNQNGSFDQERRGETAEDIYFAVKYLYEAKGFKLTDKDSLGRLYQDVMIHHENDKIRSWAKKLNALDGRFRFEDSPPVHLSKTCEVVLVTDINTNRRGVLKIFKDGVDFEREKAARAEIKKAYEQAKVTATRIGKRALQASEIKKENFQRRAAGKAPRNPIRNKNKNVKFRDQRRKIEIHQLKKKDNDYSKFLLDFLFISTAESSFKYMFFELADKNLFEIMNTERVAGINVLAIKEIARQAAKCLRFINEKHYSHCDFKPRNFVRVNYERNFFKLIDFDASVRHGKRCGQKYSSAYCPPELAKYVFIKKTLQPIAENMFDVWSFGVVLFELLSGTPLFQSMKVDDNLFSNKSKAKLINWVEISDDKIDQVLDLHDKSLPVKEINFAKSLVRWCLQRNRKHRPTFRQILNHPFLSKAKAVSARTPVGVQRMLKSKRTHFFLSHIQSQAAGSVKDLYYSTKELGCLCWLDMKRDVITQESMFNGVEYCQAFVVALTRDTFFSMFCLKELLWAVDFNKKIVFLQEVDPREYLFPFSKELFLEKFEDVEWIKETAQNLGSISELGLSEKTFRYATRQGNVNPEDVSGTIWVLENVLRPKVLEILESPTCIPYRRREYENVAMLDYMLECIGFISPNNEQLEDEYKEVAEQVVVNKRNSVLNNRQNNELLDMIRNNNLKAKQNFVRGGRTKSGKFNIKFTDGELDKIENSTVFVLVGKEGEDMLNEVREMIFELLPLASPKKQWIELREDEPWSKRYSSKTKNNFAVLSLITPGFFQSSHRDSYILLQDICRRQRKRMPNVLVQDNWFNRDYDLIKAELGPELGHLLLHHEIMPYRAKDVRLYEHRAMVGEIARRIVNYIRT